MIIKCIKSALFAFLSGIVFFAHAQTRSATCHLLVGTYTSEKSQGIHVYAFNITTGEFSQEAVAATNNPSYLAITRDCKYVFAVNEESEGSVSAFSFNASTGQLIYLNSASSGGDGPCYISVDDKNKFVFTGNYGGGSITAIPINADGSLSQDIQVIPHAGKSIKPNQDKPHVHAAILSPDNMYLFVPDLGTDKVFHYKVDVLCPKPLAPANPAFTPVAVGGGPRHFTFHPNGKYAYLIHENTGDITVYDYANGQLKEKQTVYLPEAGYTGDIHAADIHISPDGKFLYGSMRADINEIVIFSVDRKGRLKVRGRQSTLGKSPRNFAIDPTGNFLLAANQNSDEIVIFRRDKLSGLLTDTGKRIQVGRPVCLKFVTVN